MAIQRSALTMLIEDESRGEGAEFRPVGNRWGNWPHLINTGSAQRVKDRRGKTCVSKRTIARRRIDS
jgi:hypothetical protein